jgi:hypothetical protein
MLSQLGVNTKTAGDDASGGKDRRPPAPPAANLAASPAGQILPGQITRLPVEARPAAALNVAPAVARPLQLPPSMENNAAHSSLEAPRLVAKNRGVAGVAPQVRAEILTSDAPVAPKHAKVLTDGASRKSDVPVEGQKAATNPTRTAERMVVQAPASTARAATVSPAAYTVSDVVAAPAPRSAVVHRQAAVINTTTASTPIAAKKDDGQAAKVVAQPAGERSVALPAPAGERARPVFTKEEAFRPVVKNEGEAKPVKPEAPKAAVQTAATAVAPKPEAPAANIKTPAFQAVAVKAETVAVKAETVAVKAETVAVKAETVAVKAETVAVKTETRAAKTETPAVKAETVAVKTESRAAKTELPAAKTELPAAKAETSAPAPQTAAAPHAAAPVAKRAAAKAEVAPLVAPSETVKSPVATEAAPVATKNPAVAAQPAAVKAAPAQPVAATEERPVAAAEKAASPAEGRPAAARKNPAPVRARGEDELTPVAAAPVAGQPVAQVAAPAAVRPVTAVEATPIAVEQVVRATARPVVTARAQVTAEPVEVPSGERRKRPAGEKSEDSTAETAKPGILTGAPAPLAAPTAFERLTHRAAPEGQAKVESLGRREADKEPARATEAATPANPFITPDQQNRTADKAVNLPVFTAPAPQADAAPVAFAPAAAAPIVAHAVEDPGLSVTVLPQAARVSVESAEGDLALHLRIKDGNAEISMGGSLAPMFEQRSAEVQTVLAGEGLALGRFDFNDNNRQGQQAPREVPGDDATPARPATTTQARPSDAGEEQPVRAVDGRIHVTA